jgi:hypothetical protein
MEMSKAALPPPSPRNSAEDAKHPRWDEYQKYRAAMRMLLVEASSFKSWLRNQEFEEQCNSWKAHPRYKEFMDWMHAHQGGARKIPKREAQSFFPYNFQFWLDGVRW